MRVLLAGSVSLIGILAASSAQAEPTVRDCLLATETSISLRADHKLRAARAQLVICSAPTCPAEVREECGHRLDEVNAALPTVVFTAKTAAGEELSRVKVTMDGEVVTDHLDGTALSLDPGSHPFTFESAGAPALSETMILHEGEKNRRELVVLGVLAPVAVAATIAPTATRDPPAAPTTVATPPSTERGRGPWGGSRRRDHRRCLRRRDPVGVEPRQERMPRAFGLHRAGDHRQQHGGDGLHRLHHRLRRGRGATRGGADTLLHGAPIPRAERRPHHRATGARHHGTVLNRSRCGGGDPRSALRPELV
jgi:hypothetical protein